MDVVDLSQGALLWLVIATAFASLISSVTGMAGGVLMFAAMSLCLPLRVLVPIHGAVQVFNNAARSWFLRRHIRWRMCLPFAVGATLGAAATTLFIVRYIGEFFPLLLLAGLILYTLFKPARLPDLKIPDRGFFWVGLITGGMGILVGAIDPLLAVFFLRDDLSKEEIVGNKSLMQMFAHLTKVPAYLYLGFSFIDNAGLILLLTVSAVVGARLGLILLARVSTRHFLQLMRLALMLAALRIGYQLIQMGV
ncbi:sulfite exporter TauE/SafE family protein [Parahaliea aestuarii]|uniref:Probable membrane transporter protein n=1 Tax=Parahaliea aestuarii TaxID=1852021 RepID=A0A5C8ZZH0_9GAMM|nr:sulfite exporter TauE/SafE family protein [Parahaliea aestuarii]TXS93199.1 sulfite exporter TauE/SafE family protein [Parahaliea aestuarii]